jgi:hypothetical protein
MKTIDSVQAEARQLTLLGQQYREEHTQGDGRIAAAATPLELARLPHESALIHGERSIDVVMRGDDVLYRLVEREQPGTGPLLSANSPSVVMVSDSAFDVLRSGYELAEEERLAERLAPYVDRDRDSDESDPGETAAEVEAILETDLLSPSNQLRTKAEIGEFLDGRLETNDLIARTVVRRSHREGAHEVPRESLAVRHALTLTIDEH